MSGPPGDEDGDEVFDEGVEIPIDGDLDLHAFHPRDVRTLVPDYLDACREAGILEVRLVHGKGTGQLRRTVHALLERHPHVVDWQLDPRGNWGVTIARLRSP